VYIFIEFAPSVTLGCFIFEIDPQNLGLDSAEDLQLVDSDGSLLLRGGQLPEQSQNFDLGDETIFYADGATQRTTQQLYYKVDNNTFHWSLLLPLGDASQSIAYDALRWQLPTLLGLILFGLAAAYFITRAIYAPIYRLCQVVSERSGTSLSGQQELDYLEDAYQQTLQDNDQLQTQVSELGRDTRQYLCRAAIRGELRPGADVDHLLESLPEGELQVAIVRPGEAGETLPVELGTLTGQLSECLCALSEPPNGLVLILCPPPEGVGERLKAWLKQASGATGCPLLCGLGKAKGLYQLKDSYEEAVYDLQYNAYQAAEGDNAPEEMELGQNLAGKKKYYYVEEGKRFIRDNYQNPALSVNDICAHVGITPSYFSSLFNELTQESVTSYLNRIRVEQAKIMLLQTRTPVKDIGTQCGFNSPNGFGRVFKRYTDQSPKQFRDSQRSISEVAYDD
jgi:AraC-like DNA-binding protein